MKNKKKSSLASATKWKIKWKPKKGYKYLKDLKPGSIFVTDSGMRGVLINCNVNAIVIIMNVPNIHPDDVNYYLGKHIIAARTEVKEVK